LASAFILFVANHTQSSSNWLPPPGETRPGHKIIVLSWTPEMRGKKTTALLPSPSRAATNVVGLG
jgi:hypothetical protein